jgi:antitoxin ParD1/3/4
MDSMNLTLPPGLEEFVQARVAAGGYSSIGDYVRDLIRADQRHEAKRALENEILKGIMSGDSVPMTKSDWQDIRDEVRARCEAYKPQ